MASVEEAPQLLGAAARIAGLVLLVVLAVVLLRHRPDHRASRTFAYVLLLSAASGIPFRYVVDLAGDAGRYGWPWFQGYLGIAFPFAVAYFGAVFPRPRPWLAARPWAPWALLGLVLVLEAVYAVDHGLYSARAAGERSVAGPLGLLAAFAAPVRLAVAAVLARDFARAPAGPERGALLLVALALALSPAYQGARWLLYEAAGLEPVTGPGSWLERYLAYEPGRLLVMLALPLAGILAWRLGAVAVSSAAGGRGLARRGLAALALAPAAAALVTAVYLARPEVIPLIFNVFPNLFGLAFPVLITYALLRFRVFDIDLRVKGSIRQGVVAGAFVGTFVLASEGTAPWLGGAAPYLGVVAAGALLLALTRVRRFADRFADLALPGVQPTPAYLRQRRLDVYRAALEQAVAGADAPAPREAAMLASLRQELGVTPEEHAFLELAVRAAGPGARRPPPAPGEVMLGRYRVMHKVGSGAHGTTFLAEDIAAGSRVALKVLRPDVAADGALREARALREVRHPHVVALRDVVEAGGQAYLVTEYLEGGSLAERLAQGALAPADFARLARGLLEGLGAVHAGGLVHRDVKPGNVLLTAAGEPKLADFGVAHVPGVETTLGGRDAGSALGTVRYMSPEQAKGRRATRRSDLFSAAATLYEACTGAPYLQARKGESTVELQIRAAAGQRFRAPPGMPPPLRAWFAKALAPDPAARFPTAAAMRDALERALAAGPPGAHHGA